MVKYYDMVKTHIKKDFSLEILMAYFIKLHGKELSYNNLLDVDAAVNLMAEFKNDGSYFCYT